MAKYHLVHIDSKKTFFNLSRLEMVNKLKQASDLHNWFCWYPGIAQWKQVNQAHEIREWMTTHWTEDQPMPPWQDLFITRARSESQDFEVVEFNDSPALTPPPVPTDPKTEFIVSGFSGQVFDFDESLKDKHLNKDDFKILKDKNRTGDEAIQFENTVKVDTTANDFEKTISSSTVLTTEKTQTAIANSNFERTGKINLNETQHVNLETVTSKIETVPDMTITKELPTIEKEGSLPENTTPTLAQAVAGAKKHNRRYPRIKGRLRTIITNKAKAFMTFTKDISLGGIQVENNIPQDILNSEIEVYVSDPTGKKSILFRCHPVGDMKNPCRFSFAKADEKNLQKLSQWLDDLAKINAA